MGNRALKTDFHGKIATLFEESSRGSCVALTNEPRNLIVDRYFGKNFGYWKRLSVE